MLLEVFDFLLNTVLFALQGFLRVCLGREACIEIRRKRSGVIILFVVKGEVRG